MHKIPSELKKRFESIGQIIGILTKLRQFDEAPYEGHMLLLIALLGTV